MRAVPRTSLQPGAWDAFVAAHPDGWFWHSERWIDYALAYAPGSRDASEAAVGDDGTVLGVQPLVYVLQCVPTLGGQPPVGPLLTPEIVAYGAGKGAYGVFSAVVRPDPPPTLLTVPFDASEADQWRRVRKSYKSLIHAAERAYDIGVYSHGHRLAARALVGLAKALHVKEAGRQTRSDETWEMMGDWLAEGYGVLVLAFRRLAVADASIERTPDAFAYAIRWKGRAYWASGASLVPNLQHALQWALIKTLRLDGETRAYDIGYAARPGDSEKLRNIAHFKAGFC